MKYRWGGTGVSLALDGAPVRVELGGVGAAALALVPFVLLVGVFTDEKGQEAEDIVECLGDGGQALLVGWGLVIWERGGVDVKVVVGEVGGHGFVLLVLGLVGAVAA